MHGVENSSYSTLLCSKYTYPLYFHSLTFIFLPNNRCHYTSFYLFHSERIRITTVTVASIGRHRLQCFQNGEVDKYIENVQRLMNVDLFWWSRIENNAKTWSQTWRSWCPDFCPWSLATRMNLFQTNLPETLKNILDRSSKSFFNIYIFSK